MLPTGASSVMVDDVDRKETTAPLHGFLRLVAQDAINLQILLDSAQVEAWEQYRTDILGRYSDIAVGPEDAASGDLVRSTFESLTQLLSPPRLNVIDFDVDMSVMIAKSREVSAGIDVSPINIGYHIRYGTKVETSSRLSFTVRASPVPIATEAKHHGR